MRRGRKDYTSYWARLAREHVSWKNRSRRCSTSRTRRSSSGLPMASWNVSYNCLDRNVEAGLGDKVAIIFEADDGSVTKVT